MATRGESATRGEVATIGANPKGPQARQRKRPRTPVSHVPEVILACVLAMLEAREGEPNASQVAVVGADPVNGERYSQLGSHCS